MLTRKTIEKHGSDWWVFTVLLERNPDGSEQIAKGVKVKSQAEGLEIAQRDRNEDQTQQIDVFGDDGEWESTFARVTMDWEG